VNVHGCGIGWYGTRPGGGLLDAIGLTSYERPAVYTTTSAPTHDRNLRSLAKMLEASLLFGHVRAAGPGASVHQFNCHPFQAGRFLFMHNGEVAGASPRSSPRQLQRT
jgi:glutamine amidotransferase